jgi:hypothetical protein
MGLSYGALVSLQKDSSMNEHLGFTGEGYMALALVV